MIIEINKDIDKYQESVVLGLTARQLIFSAASVIVGAGLVFLLYRYVGMTVSAYIAIPCVAPIALGGFYSYNGMDFYEYVGRKVHFLFGNGTLTYVSTENADEMKKLMDGIVMEQPGNEREFDSVKKKMMGTLFGTALLVILAMAVAIAYRFMR